MTLTINLMKPSRPSHSNSEQLDDFKSKLHNSNLVKDYITGKRNIGELYNKVDYRKAFQTVKEQRSLRSQTANSKARQK